MHTPRSTGAGITAVKAVPFASPRGVGSAFVSVTGAIGDGPQLEVPKAVWRTGPGRMDDLSGKLNGQNLGLPNICGVEQRPRQ